MNPKYLLNALVLLLIFSLQAHAQIKKRNEEVLTLHFAPNSTRVSAEMKAEIEAFCNELDGPFEGLQAELIGHTDHIGGTSVNQQVAAKRARNVARQFQTLGFLKQNINTSAAGLSQPIASNADSVGRAQNRRVEIRVQPLEINLLELLGEADPWTETYEVTAETGNRLHYRSGTAFQIPPDAFVDANGNPVTGKVTINYREFRKELDFALSGIPMSVVEDGEELPLNSAGMFEITAFQNGQKLELAAGKSIDFAFAAEQMIPGLNFYYLDPETNSWDKLRTLTPGEGGPKSTPVIEGESGQQQQYMGPICGNDRSMGRVPYNSSCFMDDCEGTDYALRLGAALASEPGFIDPFMQTLPVRGIANPTANKIDSAIFPPTYTCKILKSNSKKVVLRLRPAKAHYTITSAMEDVVWKINRQSLSSRKQKELTREPVQDISLVHLRDNEFRMLFKRGNKTIKVNRAQAVFTGKRVPNKDLEGRALAMAFDFQTRKARVSPKPLPNFQLGNRTNNFNDPLAAAGSPYMDSLRCFYTYSKPYMSREELGMDFRMWLDYFNLNKALMSRRYGNLLSDAIANNELESCKQAMALVPTSGSRISGTVRTTPEEWKREIEIVQAAGQFTFGITNLGIYNCDQVARIQQPVFARASYETVDGNDFYPIRIYVIDKAINGVLTYVGKGMNSPALFPYSSVSQQSLIAVDADSQLYFADAEEFTQMAGKKGGKVQFTLRPWKQLDELADAVANP